MQKKKVLPPVHSSETASFRVPSPDWLHKFLTMPTPKNFQSLFNLHDFVPGCKKISLFHLIISEIQSNLESSEQIAHTHF